MLIPSAAGASYYVLPNPTYPELLTAQAQGPDTFERSEVPRPLPVKPLVQGNTNGCGTTALAMALNSLAALNQDDMDYQPFTREMLDPGNRELNSFIAPSLLVRAARDNGAYAQMYNNGTFEEIRSHIDQGHPIISLISSDRTKPLGGLHYVVIINYHDAEDPNQRSITYVDPGSGGIQEQNYSQFVTAHSQDLKMGLVPTYFSNLLIVFSSKDDLPPSRGIPATNYLATGTNNLLNTIGVVKNRITGN